MPEQSTAFKTTKINVKSFPKECLDEMEQGFMNLEAAKTDAVEGERNGAIAASKAIIARQNANIAMVELLKQAAHQDARIAAENNWIVYKNSDGEIIFEGITERVQRNAIRAQIRNMGQGSQDFPNDKDMYEEGDDSQGA